MFELTEQDKLDSKIYQKADEAYHAYRRLEERNVKSACEEAYRYGYAPPWVDDEFERNHARIGLVLTKTLKALAEAQGMSLSDFFESKRGLCPKEAAKDVKEYLQLLKARRDELKELETRREHLLDCIKGWEEFPSEEHPAPLSEQEFEDKTLLQAYGWSGD